MRIQDRYASAVHSSNLQVDERTTFSDTDVLGAVGLAARARSMREHEDNTKRRRADLAFRLMRLFSGDNGVTPSVVEILGQMVRAKAASSRLKMSEVQAIDIARACLAWHRDGACRPCGGHGVLKIVGTTTLGAVACKACKPTPNASAGTGKRRFESEFHSDFRGVATWIVSEMERAQAVAGPEAMAKIAPRLDF